MQSIGETSGRRFTFGRGHEAKSVVVPTRKHLELVGPDALEAFRCQRRLERALQAARIQHAHMLRLALRHEAGSFWVGRRSSRAL